MAINQIPKVFPRCFCFFFLFFFCPLSLASLSKQCPPKNERIPESIGRYPCSYCACTFVHLASKKQHLKSTHKGIRPYTCSLCHKQFSKKKAFDRHVQLVSCQTKKLLPPEPIKQELSYKGGLIPQHIFIDVPLSFHVQFIHHLISSQIKYYTCKLCHKEFFREDLFHRHIQSLSCQPKLRIFKKSKEQDLPHIWSIVPKRKGAFWLITPRPSVDYKPINFIIDLEAWYRCLIFVIHTPLSNECLNKIFNFRRKQGTCMLLFHRPTLEYVYEVKVPTDQ